MTGPRQAGPVRFPKPTRPSLSGCVIGGSALGPMGLILLQNDPDYDFRMVYFNADGAEGSMCGNGGRCIVRFAHDLGLFESETRFRAVDGEHVAVVCEEDIFLKMGNVAGIETRAGLTFLNTGSPHVVRFVDDLESVDVVAEGRAIRYDATFPGWHKR